MLAAYADSLQRLHRRCYDITDLAVYVETC